MQSSEIPTTTRKEIYQNTFHQWRFFTSYLPVSCLPVNSANWSPGPHTADSSSRRNRSESNLGTTSPAEWGPYGV